jgi:hypothetical protein
MAGAPSAEPVAGDFFVLAVLMMSPSSVGQFTMARRKEEHLRQIKTGKRWQGKVADEKKDSRSCLFGLRAVARKRGITWRRQP